MDCELPFAARARDTPDPDPISVKSSKSLNILIDYGKKYTVRSICRQELSLSFNEMSDT
jgi:hypothetical protein